MKLEDMAAIAAYADELASTYDPEVQGFISHLALSSKMVNQAPDDWYYRNYYDLVLREAAEPRIQEVTLPDYYEPMEPRQCFYNSWCLVQETPGLVYVEGFAQCRGIPVEHAWVEEVDGSIIDTTWAAITDPGDEAIYFGVRFTSEMAVKLSLQTGWSSILQGDNYADNQILRRGLKMHERLAIDLNEVGT